MVDPNAVLLLVVFVMGFVASGVLEDALRRAAEHAAARLPAPSLPFDPEVEIRALFDRALEQARDSAMRRAHAKERGAV